MFLGPLPCRGEKGLSQVRESSMSHSDDLTVSPGESVGQRPEVLFTPGKIQRRGQCLPRACQKTKKRSLCWEDTGHPVRCGVLHEAQAWAAGEGQPGTGLRQPQGGTADMTVKEGQEVEKEPRRQVRGLRDARKCPAKELALNVSPKLQAPMPHLSPVLHCRSGACIWAGRKGRSRPCRRPLCRRISLKQAE